ncbi:hypothetical protein FGE12_23650 [Aggregicoccus sp. 17bor-14]|uniref:DUF4846 domain-containing protein n=1 Tax=Myxococcaceae TaxID=31 RepID=UPI00129C7CFB|nr:MULTISPECIES: DUF4846 domain-containing protein [Myxococcaceae]MBF5045421.1 DUF4846 domain-containing protein [Simulacricoccus sp. 17bor-14]MRI91162.1 hypothetical protein [Aggregicoccus sp. 17bor-14]
MLPAALFLTLAVLASSPQDTLAQRFPPPAGYVREDAAPSSFATWLRALPLRPAGSPVRLYTGALKRRQDVHAGVLALDTGTRDLQQCADAVIRLRAEYLYARGRLSELHFRTTSGEPLPFARWAAGERPQVRGRHVTWTQGGRAGTDRANLRAYLDVVFTYAGTQSLAQELRRVDVTHLQAGDVFLQPGAPGHAVLVVDTAVQPRTGARLFLLAQGYMPAQDVHVLRNLEQPLLGAWYALDFGEQLRTPEWTFTPKDLWRFE